MIRFPEVEKDLVEKLAAKRGLSVNAYILQRIREDAADQGVTSEAEVTPGYTQGQRFYQGYGYDEMKLKRTRVIRMPGGTVYHLCDNEGVALKEYKSKRNTLYYVVEYTFEPGSDGVPEDSVWTRTLKSQKEAFIRFLNRKVVETKGKVNSLVDFVRYKDDRSFRELMTLWTDKGWGALVKKYEQHTGDKLNLNTSVAYELITSDHCNIVPI